jgi:hypothetical protein
MKILILNKKGVNMMAYILLAIGFVILIIDATIAINNYRQFMKGEKEQRLFEYCDKDSGKNQSKEILDDFKGDLINVYSPMKKEESDVHDKNLKKILSEYLWDKTQKLSNPHENEKDTENRKRRLEELIDIIEKSVKTPQQKLLDEFKINTLIVYKCQEK